MYDILFFTFEIIGTIAFAASGALMGMKKHMDLLGIYVLGCITAVGGGVIRDVLLGATPPRTFENPIYIIIALITSIICTLPTVRRLLKEKDLLDTRLMWFMDSLGLGVFTVMGIQTAQSYSPDYNIFLLIFVGVITGVGGGILRDVLAQEKPYIFVKHFYATAALIGAVLCCLLWNYIDITINSICCAALIVVIRMLAARFRWKLPAPE